jgi:hypothetical protein
MQPINQIIKIVESWLNPDNPNLLGAIEKTVDESLFSKQDIEFQLDVLRENVKSGEILEWIQKAGLSHQKNGKKVLCLHAGNLPLVGFQAALGVMLSGADYHGKLSRKDPYLLASFLEELQKAGLDQEINSSTDLSAFKDLQADSVVFAGSQESVPEVKAEIKRLQAAKMDAEFVIRTAKFSIAYLDEWNPKIRQQLTEAMLRYGGKGCRSVAVVVARFGLDEAREALRESFQKFWDVNPQHQKPAGDLKYQYAYDQGIQRKQIWLEDFLIQESEELPETDFTVNWVNGDEDKARKLRMEFESLVQSVYTGGCEIEGIETEPLAKAQRPPLWWKPDGVDIIKELIR